MSAIDPSFTLIITLLLLAMVAGYIDTLVGGGGLITIPALMAAGLPPLMALGTNKLQAIAGSGTASLTLMNRRQIRFADVKWLMLLAFIGSMIGSVIVQAIDTSALNIIIPVVLLFIAIYFIVSPNTKQAQPQVPRLTKRAYASTAVPTIGFYDGMFGPGTGSFFAWAGVSLQGQLLVQSTMIAKTLNFASNSAGLMIFIYFGKVVWLLGGIMIIGQIVGANLGARTLIVTSPNILRYLVIVMCFTILIFWMLR